MSGTIVGRGESVNLSRRQASILSKRKAAEELQLARQQELEAEAQEAERCKKAKKEHQPVPLWTEADREIFFNSIIACGRDFEKMHTWCAGKMSVARPQSQMRRLYISLAKKVLSALRLPTVSKNKEATELFALINWAEFRRRTETRHTLLINHKHNVKLTELIYTGETKVKRRGKLMKIRTPVCAPLTRLIGKAGDEAVKDASSDKRRVDRARVPDLISLELQPKSNAAWHRVSDIAHNPHLRLKVKSEQSLSTAIEAVERKWVPSTVRFQRELQLLQEWDKLPYIKVYPSDASKLRPFDLSLCQSSPAPSITFREYLRRNNEDTRTEAPVDADLKPADVEGEDRNGDPVKFLKDKLLNITSQISGEQVDSATEGSEAKEADTSTEVNDTKSHDWIDQARDGWTASNSQDLSLGALYLLFGSPEKICLEYDWPELERGDEVVHMFAGMINKLINIAHNEFGKKKMVSNIQTSPTANRSPSARGKRPSPSSSRSLQNLVALKPVPAKDSPEFKKPGVPLQSENRQLADAIALGRQELKPYARRLTMKPKQVVQKNILPNRIAVPIVTHSSQPDKPRTIAPNPSTSSGKTQVMDVSCLPSFSTGRYGVAKRKTQSTEDSQAKHTLQGLINDQSSHNFAASSSLADSLSQILSSPLVSTSSPELAELQSLMSASSNGQSASDTKDLLTQAVNAMRTPEKKRRITPTLISTTVEGTVFSAESNNSIESRGFPSTLDVFEESSVKSASKKNTLEEGERRHPLNTPEHSLSSLLRSISGAMNKTSDASCTSDSSAIDSASLTFRNFLSNQLSGKEMNPAELTNETLPSGSTTAPVTDAWLTPDVAMTDLSLSSLLGDKSPRRNGADSSVSAMLLTDRLTSTIGSDDTRMSFLNRLDVSELGMDDSSFPNMLGGDSVDYMMSPLETPQKKSGTSS